MLIFDHLVDDLHDASLAVEEAGARPLTDVLDPDPQCPADLRRPRGHPSWLVALGGTTDLLVRTQLAEIGLVAMPRAIGGTLLRSVLIGIPLTGIGLAWIVTPDLAIGIVAFLVWLEIRLATVITKPWLRGAPSPANLRTA